MSRLKCCEENVIENDSLKFIHIRKIKPNPTWHNNYNVHPYHELIVVLSGILHVSGVNQKLELHPGDAAFYPAGVQHWENADADAPVEHCFLVFEDPTFSGDQILVNREQGVLLRAMGAALYEFSLAGDPAVFGNEYLKLMLKIFFTNSPCTIKTSSMVHKVHSYIRQNMSYPITLMDLARAAELSKYHFLHQYRRECGITPMRALWEMRCAEAVSLLKYTNMPIKEIASRTGFSDIKHFFHRIKAFSGAPPSQFRSWKKTEKLDE